MIVDLDRFLTEERPYWDELEAVLKKIEADAGFKLDLVKARRLYYLYQRTAADLSKVATFASEPELRNYLETLVGRAYGEIHESRARTVRFSPLQWFFGTLPRTFRKHAWAFYLSLAVTLVGSAFGCLAMAVDTGAKDTLLPYAHLQLDPSERVALEEEPLDFDPRQGQKAMGTSFYFVNNTKVGITTLTLGITWGIGTIVVLLMNGVLLGAVCFDYIMAGETVFLIGWLLPHGATEIPAILIAGQGGLLLGHAIIGWNTRLTVRARLRALAPDLVTLIGGVAILMAWSGIVEAYLSQYHEPVIPYWLKISFGTTVLVLLTVFLTLSGRRGEQRHG
jgi:uncharacterized membrane protein SpoIIM required for sporulation